ncbi:MAG TPA: galactose-1-phosphate uridylyltransferase [Micromonospora sp.]|nr:galactose-1-phosphate uridylyltransferase [Micromonospora sp.]
MKRSVMKLADGRELIYYDESDSAMRELVDQRAPAAPSPASQVRYDPLLDEWVTFAAHRQDRTHLPPSDQCPLCPSTPQHSTEIPARDYDVVVFENRFPSFSQRPVLPSVPHSLTPARPGGGRCEVLCFTADHHGSFSTLGPDRIRMIIDVWADRSSKLAALPGVEQVFCFENRGEEIGVTLQHPHGQIYAYPFVTPQTRRMLRSAQAYARAHCGANLFAALLAAERAAGDRVVAANEHWTAFVPAAARWPFEIHLFPHRRVPDIPALSDAERRSLAALHPQVLRRLDGLFAAPMPYIAAWHQAPVRIDRDVFYLHLRVFSPQRAPGKLKFLAGSESGMGAFINDVLPEEAARRLRAVEV